MRRLVKWLGVGVGVSLVMIFVGYGLFVEFSKPACVQGEKRDVFIKYGTGAWGIAQLLENAGIIRSKYIFAYLAWKQGLYKKLQPGEYELDCSMPPQSHLKDIAEGKVKLYKIVIPEGSNIFDVKRIFDESGLFEDPDFFANVYDRGFLSRFGFNAESAEGFIFPDTYLFPRGLTTKKALSVIFKRFWDVWEKDGFSARLAELNLNAQEIVTLASIVEKETAAEDERALIAGVFWNRLKLDMPLQADPTVAYGLLSPEDNNVRRLTKKDLLTMHPYNTYLLKGLPKGAIANPGKKAIEAVLYPKKTDYLYFVSKNDGAHQFSTNLVEHNKAVNRYQRGQD